MFIKSFLSIIHTIFPIASISDLRFYKLLVSDGSIAIGYSIFFLYTKNFNFIGPYSDFNLSIIISGLWYLISAVNFLKNWKVGPISLHWSRYSTDILRIFGNNTLYFNVDGNNYWGIFFISAIFWSLSALVNTLFIY